MADEKKFTCSCGAVYTLETLPEQCTGTRDGRRCRVEHFGDWARANARIKDALAASKETNAKVTKAALAEKEKKILYGDPAKPPLPFYGIPKWLADAKRRMMGRSKEDTN